MRKFFIDNGMQESNEEFNKELLMKNVMKCKDLEEDNKKLRKLLKT